MICINVPVLIEIEHCAIVYNHTVALEVSLDDRPMRCINSLFTYLLTVVEAESVNSWIDSGMINK